MKEINERTEKSDTLVRQMAAIEASMDGIAILNAEGEYIYVNKAHAEVYGYGSPLELIGRSWKILYDDRELKRFEQEIMPTFFINGRWRGEAVGKRCDGSRFDQELSLTTIEGGGLVCVVRDVTARKEAENALRRSQEALRGSEERYRSVVDNVGIGIALISPNMEILSLNRQMREWNSAIDISERPICFRSFNRPPK